MHFIFEELIFQAFSSCSLFAPFLSSYLLLALFVYCFNVHSCARQFSVYLHVQLYLCVCTCMFYVYVCVCIYVSVFYVHVSCSCFVFVYLFQLCLMHYLWHSHQFIYLFLYIVFLRTKIKPPAVMWQGVAEDAFTPCC